MRDHDYDEAPDEFYETLAPTIPTRTYRSGVVVVDARPTILEQIVRLIAGVLGILLGVRFIMNLFGSYNANLLSSYANNWTNWMVAPFQALIGRPGTSVGGFFDWPALIALIVLGIITSIVTSLLRPSRF
jgi:YGGT family protein